MAIALETVVKQLTDSSIISAGKLDNFVPPKATPKDGEELLRELVKQNLLTKFQAQQYAAGRGKALILGNYTLLDKIGAGGMGQVFKAEHRRMKRVVAIKMLPKALMSDPAAAARFQREVEAAAKLRHPNIVAADDADEAGGVHFLVMEYVEGSDLSALVKKSGPLPAVKALQCILQAARGLEFAHAQGVLHRDIKPANLLLDKTGQIKILDMGLARVDAPGGDGARATELTGTGAVMGTVDYMAPEQALSTRRADVRSDVYSLGCTLYYLLTGQQMYAGESVVEKLVAHREQPIPSLEAAQVAVPKPMQAVFRKMVAKNPDQRYQTMSEVVAALEAASAGTIQPDETSTSRPAILPTAQPLSDEVIESFIPASAASDAPRSQGRNRVRQQKKSVVKGPGAYAVMLLVVGVVGLAGILWIRANNLKIQLADADQLAAQSRPPSKPPQPVTRSEKKPPEHDGRASSEPPQPARHAPAVPAAEATEPTTLTEPSMPPAPTTPSVPGGPAAVAGSPPTAPLDAAEKSATTAGAATPKEIAPKEAEPAAAVDPPRPAPAGDDSPAEPVGDSRQPLPTAAARKTALEAVIEVYKSDYANAKKPADKITLAEKLLKQATDENDLVQRFTLLGEARSFALAGYSPRILSEVARKLAVDFQINEHKVLADSLDKLAEKISSKPVWAELAEVALSGADAAAADEQFDQANRLASLALNAAKKASQGETARTIASRASDINELGKQFRSAQEANAKLAADPEDAESHLVVGKYLCFGKEDWDAGILHLAKGSDPALQSLAQQEAQAPADAGERVKLGDGWWDLADASKGSLKAAYQRRAAHWYEQAQESLSGLTKSRVEKRLESVVAKHAASSEPLGMKTSTAARRRVGTKSKAPRLAVLEARFGTPEASVDVTSAVQSLMHDDRIDSWPMVSRQFLQGQKKKLFIRYSLGNVEAQAFFDEKEPVFVGVPPGMRQAPRNEWLDVTPLAADDSLAKLTWSRVDQGLKTLGEHMSRNSLAFPIKLVGEFEIEMECTRTGERDLIGIGFPVDGTMASVTAGHRGNEFRICELEGEPPGCGPLKLEFPIESNQRHKLVVRVGHDGPKATIDADLDGKKLNWKGLPSTLVPCRATYYTQGQLNLFSHFSVWQIHSLKIRAGKGLIFVPAETNKTVAAALPSDATARVEEASGTGNSVRPRVEKRPPIAAPATGPAARGRRNQSGRAPNDRQAADWVIATGGKVGITLPGSPEERTFTRGSALPAEDFIVTAIDLDLIPAIPQAEYANLEGLVHLRELHLRATSFDDEGLARIKDLVELKELGLAGSKVTDNGLFYIKDLKNLETLGLFNRPISLAGLQHLRNLTKLTDLHLSGAHITDECIPALQPFTQLRVLALTHTLVTSAGLQKLQSFTSLTELLLPQSRLSDADLPTLYSFKKLKRLMLRGTQLSDAGKQKLQTALPQCKLQF